MNNLKRDTVELISLLGIGLLAILIIILFIFSFLNDEKRVDEIKSQVVIENPFDSVKIEAKAAIVWDLRKNEPIFEYKSKDKMPLASLTKLFTAALALRTLPEYQTIVIDSSAISQEGDSGLIQDESWSVKELVKTILISSSNDGARAIAGAAGSILAAKNPADPNIESYETFVLELNNFARENGLTDSHFYNEHGLDVSDGKNGGYGSARDVAKVMDYLLEKYPDVIDSTALREVTLKSSDGRNHVAKNTNPAINSIAGVLASKTGFTDNAGGNVAVITSPGLEGPFAIVVLGSSYDGRFKDLVTLSKATLEYAVKNR